MLALDPVLRDLLVFLGLSGEDVLSYRQHHRLVADVGQVGAGAAVGPLRYRCKVHVLGQGPVPGVDLEDVEPRLLVGHPDLDHPIEPAGSEEGGIDDVGPVGGGDDNEVVERLQAVHLREDLADHPLGDVRVTDAASSRGRDGVHLVEEEDGRRGAACLAFLKVSLTARSDSPTHLERNSGPFTEMKFAWLSGALLNGRKGLLRKLAARRSAAISDLRKVYVATDQ